nr:uncharacterized protein LOC109185271 [Ipomoea batatas]
MGIVSGQYSTDLATRSCTCRRRDLTGIPCPHAVCAIWIKHGKGPIWHYVDPCYLIATYMKTYAGCIHPMAGYEEWPSTDKEPPLPPLYTAKPGRPRKLRKKSRGETSKTASTSKGGQRRELGVYLTRTHVRLHCTTCKLPGHNSRRCPQNQPHGVPVQEPQQIQAALQQPHGVPVQEPQQVQAVLQQLVQPAVQVPVHVPVHDPVHHPVQLPVEPDDVITQPEVEDNQWEIPDDILDAHWHQVDLHTGGNAGGVSLTTTNRIDVTPIQSCCHDHATATAQQGMTSKGKAVKAPSKDRRKKLPIRKYATRSKAFKSSFFGNDKDPIQLD